MNKIKKLLQRVISFALVLIIICTFIFPDLRFVKVSALTSTTNTQNKLTTIQESRFVSGLEELGLTSSSAKKSKTNLINAKLKYSGKISKAKLDKYITELNQIIDKSKIEAYLSKLPVDDTLAILAVSIPIDTKIELTSSTKSEISKASAYSVNAASASSIEWCYVDTQTLVVRDISQGNYYATWATIKQNVHVCTDGTRWTGINILSSDFNSNWWSVYNNASISNQCYKLGLTSSIRQSYQCDTKLGYANGSVTLWGHTIGAAQGTAEVHSQYMYSFWSPYRKFVNVYKSFTTCIPILGCQTGS